MKFSDKHTPLTFDDLVIEKDNIRRRLKQYADGKRTDHMVLYGPKGTGKSSAARVITDTRCGKECAAFVAPFEGSKFKAAEFDTIMSNWNWQLSMGTKVPVSVINEVDLLSPQLREKLKSFMDEHGDLGQIIATTNNLHVLSAPLQDRFDKIELPMLSTDSCLERAKCILNKEGLDIIDSDLRDQLEDFDGSLRDLASLLQDIVLAANEV
jgi:replication-associated recombination protein RarA